MADTLSPRAALGVLVPYFNSVVEPELAALRPPGVTNQTARFTLDATVLENIAEAAAGLASCGIGALLVGLSTESFPGGLAMLRQGADDLAARTQLPVFTASHATHAALRHLGARRVAVVTPFDADANARVASSFEESGFEVAGIAGLACADLAAIGRSAPQEVRRVFADADVETADALVQVGTGLPTLALVEALEAEHGKPVVVCNAALYWEALRAMGIQDPIPAFGRLLAEP